MSFSLKNAVLYKDMQSKAKKARIPTIIAVYEGLLVLVTLIVIIATNTEIASFGAMSASTYVGFFVGLVITQGVFICFIVPVTTSGTIAGEREKQTLDVLMTTNMTPFEIVVGKFLSAVLLPIVLVIGSMPMLSIALIYGGVSFGKMMLVILSLITTILFFGAFGTYFSAKLKKSTSATVVTMLIIAAIIFGSILFVTIVKGIESIINELAFTSIYGLATGKRVDFSCFFLVLYVNPATTVYNILDKTTGFSESLLGESGMVGIIKEFTTFSNNNIFLTGWGFFSTIIQMLWAYWMLYAAARSLDPNVMNKKSKKRAERLERAQKRKNLK